MAMGSHATQVPSAPSSFATTTGAYPERIMLLAPYGGGTDQCCNTTGDSETVAAGITSSGHHISVSLRREPSPALSRICVRFRHGTKKRPSAFSTVVAAAHGGGSVLLRILSKGCYMKSRPTGDYFVYNAGADAADDPPRLPFLCLLPPFTSWDYWLDVSATGLVCRRGDGEAAEFVVAQLKMVWVNGDDDAGAGPPNRAAELLLFRDGEWRVVKRIVVQDHDHGEAARDTTTFLALWEPQAVVALGGGDGWLLCWVDFTRGVVFSDVLGDQSPVLRYVPYPMEAMKHGRRRLVCTNARGAVKLVTVSADSDCGSSEHATATPAVVAVVVDTWTLKTDAMAWVLETDDTAMADDSTELWALANTPGYARFHLVVVDPVPVVASISMNGGGVADESAAATEDLDGDHTTGGIVISRCASSKPTAGKQVLCVIEHSGSGMTQLMYRLSTPEEASAFTENREQEKLCQTVLGHL